LRSPQKWIVTEASALARRWYLAPMGLFDNKAVKQAKGAAAQTESERLVARGRGGKTARHRLRLVNVGCGSGHFERLLTLE